MKNAPLSHHDFSKNLFWDVDPSTLDLDKNKRFIIQRALELGLLQDWKTIKEIYGIHTIGHEMQQIRNLDPVSLSFISMICGIKKEKFRCYTSKPSNPPHWNF